MASAAYDDNVIRLLRFSLPPLVGIAGLLIKCASQECQSREFHDATFAENSVYAKYNWAISLYDRAGFTPYDS